MRQFYLVYPHLAPESAILHALRGESLPTGHPVPRVDWRPGALHPDLSWTHYRTLLRVDRLEARSFYESRAVREAWSARELERQIDSLLYERAGVDVTEPGASARHAAKGRARPLDVLKDPLVLEFLDLPPACGLRESELEQALVDNLQRFLLELGRGFAFVARQQRITLDGDHFYIDLVFYHTLLKCYVLIDLKVGKLTHADLGQIQFYVNYYDRERCGADDNPTLGLILCSDKNDAVVRYTLGPKGGTQDNIFASRYQLHMPTRDELRQALRQEPHPVGDGAA
jgi:predicted nuclease of restriction endonuclease-like (RecB) superfamily